MTGGVPPLVKEPLTAIFDLGCDLPQDVAFFVLLELPTHTDLALLDDMLRGRQLSRRVIATRIMVTTIPVNDDASGFVHLLLGADGPARQICDAPPGPR